VTILLQGIVGSTAYGLAREGCDVDRMGMFAAPSGSFFGLNPPTGKSATITRHEPSDITLHEVGKFCSLALQCNPTILELLWLPEEMLEIQTIQSYQLRDRRSAFLSKKRVRDAYFGYATQQFTRLSNKGRFPDVPTNRIEKHARHLLRLLQQGYQLYTTGEMTVRVSNPETYFEFGRAAVESDLQVRATLLHFERLFNQASSPLPDHPDSASVEAWLRKLRTELL
jgi:predicted nucleotidyltransferase